MSAGIPAVPMIAALVPTAAPSAPPAAALAAGAGAMEPARAPVSDDRDFDVALELAAAQLAATVPQAAPTAPRVVATMPGTEPPPAELAALFATRGDTTPEPAAAGLSPLPAPLSVMPANAPGEIVLPAVADLRETFAALAARAPIGARRAAVPPAAAAPVTPVEGLRAAVDATSVAAPSAPPAPALAPVGMDGVQVLQVRTTPAPAAAAVAPPAPPTVAGASASTPAPARAGSAAPTLDTMPPAPDGPTRAAPPGLLVPMPVATATGEDAPADPAAAGTPVDPTVAARAMNLARAAALRTPVTRTTPADAAITTSADDAEAPAETPDAPADAAPTPPRSPLPVLGRLLEHVRTVIARTLGAEAPAVETTTDAPTAENAARPSHGAAPRPSASAAATPAAPAATPAPAPATPAAASAGSAPADARTSAREEPEPPAATAPEPPNQAAPAAPGGPTAPAAPAAVPAAPRASRAPDVPTDVPSPAQAAVDRAAGAMRTGDRVTLRFDGEDGIRGRIRLAMRGDTLHATIVSTGAGLEPGSGARELERLLGERGFAGAHVSVQEPAAASASATPSFHSDGQAPRDDARREAFARAHEERAQSDSQGRPGRQRPRHPEEEKA